MTTQTQGHLNVIQGRFSELKVLEDLAQQGYEVFKPFFENSKFDLVIYKPQEGFKTVQIKSTGNLVGETSYKVHLVSGTRKKGSSKRFDAESIDIMAVFVVPLNKIIYLDASVCHDKISHNVKMED